MKKLEILKAKLEDEDLTEKEIYKLLDMGMKRRKQNKELMKKWEENGEIFFRKNGKYTLPHKVGYIKGKVSIPNGRFGFIDVENEDSIFIPGELLHSAMDEDVVFVKIMKENKGAKKREAEVIKIVERGKLVVTGTYEKSTNFGFVRVKNMYKDIYISQKKSRNAKTGDFVVVKIYFWGDQERKPEGEIIKILGDPRDPEVLIEALIYNSGVIEEFPKEIINEVDKVKNPEKKDFEDRIDLTHLPIITIDGADAKDLDDAVYVEKTDLGYKLLVSIADVSHYVVENTSLDKEALNRGNSIYMVDRVIPMLPRKLSNDLCSLNPNEAKLTLTVEIQFDKNGKIIKNDFYKSIIKSKHRTTYDKINQIIEKNEDAIKEYQSIHDMVNHMLDLSKLLRNVKKRRGSIDLELPELKIILDKKDKSVEEIQLRSRGEAEKIIEDFMVIANEEVAEKLFWEEVPSIYRVHENPNKAKIEELNETLIKFGYFLKNLNDMHPSKFQQIIEKSLDRPEKFLIQKLVLRSMQRARYSNKNLGHFGLGSKYYLHFTSPIRRYSDLIVHRVLVKSIEKFMSNKEKEKLNEEFEVISKHISKTERIADKLEMDSVKIKLIQFMQDKIGNTYEAKISGMNRNKIFLELENHIEVTYNINSTKDDFMYDEENFKIINTRSKKEYTLGNDIKVAVVNASYDMMEIEVIPYIEKE